MQTFFNNQSHQMHVVSRAKWKMIRKEKFLSTLKGFTKLPGSTLRLMNLGKLTRSNNVNNVNNTPTTEDAAAPIIADEYATLL